MSPRRRDAPPGPTASARVADALRTRILQGELALGAPLREEELARTQDVSRHTVRAAFAILAAERLVDVEPYRGVRVARFSPDDLDALQELRCALETEAVRLISERHGVPWPAAVRAPIERALDDLGAAERSREWDAVTRAHTDVHRAIVAAAASPRVAHAHAQLESEIRLVLVHVRPDYPAGGLEIEHRAYVDALATDARAAVRAHLAHSTALIRAGMRDAGADRASNPSR